MTGDLLWAGDGLVPDAAYTAGERRTARDRRIEDAVALITAWDRETVRWDDMPQDIIRGFVERYYAAPTAGAEVREP